MELNNIDQRRKSVNIISLASSLVNHSAFSHTIMGLILLNTILVGLETYPTLYEPYQYWFHLGDRVLLWLFTLEIALRLLSTKPSYRYFKDSWNIFDFVIVISGHLFAGAHFITVLRILRILRILRAISIIPSLRRIVNALLMTLPSLGHITMLMGLLFYIFAVMGTMLFAKTLPEYFGSLHSSLLTLFQVVTLESWASGVMRPLLAELPWAWVYFVAFILVGTFVIFNLFVGVIVSNVEKVDLLETEMEKEKEKTESTSEGSSVSEKELALLRREISELKELVLRLHQK
jgi:voltage-gated sodium channel